MLILTHTYLLQKVLGEADIKSKDLDIYIYNIAPDLLTIHPDINSDKTLFEQLGLKIAVNLSLIHI